MHCHLSISSSQLIPPSPTCPPPHRKNTQEPHLYFPSYKQNQSFHFHKKKREEEKKEEEEEKQKQKKKKEKEKEKAFCLLPLGFGASLYGQSLANFS